MDSVNTQVTGGTSQQPQSSQNANQMPSSAGPSSTVPSQNLPVNPLPQPSVPVSAQASGSGLNSSSVARPVMPQYFMTEQSLLPSQPRFFKSKLLYAKPPPPPSAFNSLRYVFYGKTQSHINTVVNYDRGHVAIDKDLINDDTMRMFQNALKEKNIQWNDFERLTPRNVKKHKVLWRTSVLIDDCEYIGIGKSRKNAKKSAAKQALKDVKRVPLNLNDPNLTYYDYFFEFCRIFKDVRYIFRRYRYTISQKPRKWFKSIFIGEREFRGTAYSKKMAKLDVVKQVLRAARTDPTLYAPTNPLKKNWKRENVELMLTDNGLTIIDHYHDVSLKKYVKAYHCEYCRFIAYSFKRSKRHVKTLQHQMLRSMNSDDRNRFYGLFDENLEMEMSKTDETIEFRCVRCDSQLISGLLDAETHVQSDLHQNKPNVKYRKTLENGRIYYVDAPQRMNAEVSDEISNVNAHRGDVNWNVSIQIGGETLRSSGPTKEKAAFNALKKHFDRKDVKDKHFKEACELFEGIKKDWEFAFHDETVPNVKERKKWSAELKTQYGNFKFFRNTVQNAKSVTRKRFIRKIINDKEREMKTRVMNQLRN